MPSLQWHVEPVRVSRTALPVGSDLCELEAVANNSLVSILRQLSSLVVVADKVLTDINDECKIVFERTVALRHRVESLNCRTRKLNAKHVKVPVADLNKFMKIENHFKRKERIDTNLLRPETRSVFMKEAYQKANATPVPIIGRSAHYRENGVQTYDTCLLKPMHKENTALDIMDIETQKPAGLAISDKLPRSVILMRAKSPLFKSMGVSNEEQASGMLKDEIETDSNDSIYRLPSPKEMAKAVAGEYPASYIPIDTSGVGFQRMCSFRRSLIHSEYCIRRKNNLTHKEKSKRVRRRNTVSEVVDFSESATESDRKRLRRRSEASLRRIDNFCQTETNENEIYSSGRVIDCLQRSSENKIELKVEIHTEEGYNVDNCEQHSEASQTKQSCNQSHHSKSLSPLSNIGVKLRDPVRSKSGDDGRSSSGNWSASSSTHASVDSDNVVSTDDNTFGDQKTLNSSNSSIEKDSVISDGNCIAITSDTSHNELNGYLSDTSGISALNKDQSQVANTSESVNPVVVRSNSKVSVKFANRNSESWLQYFDYDSSDTITPSEIVASDSDTVTSKTNSPKVEKCTKFQEFSTSQMDDELESVYSVDTDGYYTSMHTDSGLFRDRPAYKLMITPNSSFRCKGKRDSISSVSTVGDVSINSILSKTETETSSSQMSRKTPQRYPPSPPTRISSLQTHSLSNGSSYSSRSHSPSPLMTTSESEKSETVKRLKSKTAIDVTIYPSLCAAVTTSEGSAEDVNSSSSSSTESVTKKRKLSFGGYKRFKIKDIFGSLTTLTKSISKSKESLSKKKASSPVPFNMYGESKLSAQKLKQISVEKSDLALVSQALTTFNADDESAEETSDLDKSTKLYPTRRYCPSSQGSRNIVAHSMNSRGLDDDERIVYTSNSLGRRRDGHPMNYLNKYQQEPKQRAATIPGVNKPRVSSPLNKTSEVTVNSSLHDSNISKRNSYTKNVFKIKEIHSLKKHITSGNVVHSNPTSINQCTVKRSDHATSQSENQSQNNIKNQSTGIHKISQSKQDVKYCKTGSISPVSNSSIDIFNSKKSKLSTEDLLHLIHTSKKKLSLKTDSSFESSPANSSKSVSPMNSPQNHSSKRQSWAGETGANQLNAGSRHSLAIDRLGQLKATTINDFKRLLSQTRINNNTERKSASEMLKASSPFCKRPPTPVVQANIFVENVVPVETRTRIINGRVYRSPYRLERMYPPIEEVGSEENLLKGDVKTSEMMNSADTSQYFRSSSTWV